MNVRIRLFYHIGREAVAEQGRPERRSLLRLTVGSLHIRAAKKGRIIAARKLGGILLVVGGACERCLDVLDVFERDRRDAMVARSAAVSTTHF